LKYSILPLFGKAKPIIEAMRSKRCDSHYENFESLNSKRLSWKKKRSKYSRVEIDTGEAKNKDE
jgi:hypothetical protein